MRIILVSASALAELMPLPGDRVDIGLRGMPCHEASWVALVAQLPGMYSVTHRPCTLRLRDGSVFIRPISARYMHQKEIEHYEKVTQVQKR